MTPVHGLLLRKLYDTYNKQLFQFAYGKLKDRSAAEDIVQQTFEIARKKEDTLE